MISTTSPNVSHALPRIGLRAPAARDAAFRAAVCRVCHVVWRFDVGGLERQLAQQIPHLHRFGVENVLLIRGDASDRQLIPPREARVISDPQTQPSRGWFIELAEHLRDCRADLLHVRGLSMLPDGVAAAAKAGVRVVFSFHGIEQANARLSWWRRRVVRAALRRCDARFAVSAAARDWIVRQTGMVPEAFEVLHNGVDTDHFAPADSPCAARARLGLPLDRTVLLAVGNLKPIKGHDLLLDAIQRTGLRADRLVTVLVGHDEAEARTARRIAALEGFDVRAVGLRDDVRDWYHAADLFVLPSRWEGFPNALLEAMACGLPAVATRVGGVPELLRDNETGLLVAPDDAAALALALRALLADADRRAALGAAARRRVETEFGLSRAARRLADLYERVGGGAA